MVIGCATDMEHYQMLKDLGFDYIELQGKAVCAMDDKQYQSVVNTVRQGTLPCMGFNAYCGKDVIIAGPGFNAANAFSYAKKCAKRAEGLGVRTVEIGSPFSRMLPEGYDRALAKKQAVDFFAATASAFVVYDIAVCVEALGVCFCNFINTVEEAVEIIKAAEMPNLGLILDFYNMEHNSEADMDLAPYGQYIRTVHISDDDGSPQRRYFLKAEKYPIHQSRILRLMETGYDGAITIEIDLQVDPSLAGDNLRFLKSML